MVIFSYFPANVHIVKPSGMVNLKQFYRAISNPSDKMKDLFVQIRKASDNGDIPLKQKLKEHLFYFTPAVKIKERRSYEGIEYFTGILPLDFDKIDNAKEFKEFIFNEHPFIMSAWLSASGKGVRALVKIPIVKTVGQFKEYFAGIEKTEPANFRQFVGFDGITKNPTQPLFLSYDPDILIRNNADLWDVSFIEQEIKKPIIKYNQASATYFERKAQKSISRITNEGHFILRATAFMLGGYVGSGALDQFEAQNIINRCIEGHSYLSQKSEIYKKTAMTMISKGSLKPLTV